MNKKPILITGAASGGRPSFSSPGKPGFGGFCFESACHCEGVYDYLLWKIIRLGSSQQISETDWRLQDSDEDKLRRLRGAPKKPSASYPGRWANMYVSH